MKIENFDQFSDNPIDMMRGDGAIAAKIKMPKNKKEVDELVNGLRMMISKHDKNIDEGKLQEIADTMIRKIEVDQDKDFQMAMYKASSALSGTLKDAHEAGVEPPNAATMSHLLTTALATLEQDGVIEIKVKKLK